MILIPDHQLQIRNTKIYSPKIKNPFKLVALGDTHVSEMMEKTKLYPVQLQIEKENPDYIALVGDIVDAPSQLQHTYVQKKVIELVKAAAEVAPVFIVLGSHDYVDHKNQKDIYFYQRHFWEDIIGTIDNVHLLYNDTYQDQQAFFMGYWQTLDYYYNPNDVRHENLEKFHEDFIKYPELYQNLPEDTVRIALIHSPEFTKLEKNRQLIKDYDLLIIIGSKTSSNTNKLYELALKYHQNKKVLMIGSKKDLFNLDLSNYQHVAIFSGTSTPNEIINEVKQYLEEEYSL